MKKCLGCGSDIEDDISICPYCHYEHEAINPELEMIMQANQAKDENDTEFRV